MSAEIDRTSKEYKIGWLIGKLEGIALQFPETQAAIAMIRIKFSEIGGHVEYWDTPMVGMRKIREYDCCKDSDVSFFDLRCFVGMLETGEATLADFEACGIDLEAVCRRYGSANCWTGTSGKLAGKLLEILKGMQ